jgi:pyridoxal phosphate enzyme (YggS family)
MVLRERIDKVEERIQAAARRAGRARADITLVAVTKKFPAEVIHTAYDLGLRVFGENYVQEFQAKHPALTDLVGAEFHLIGHLQSNKARVAADLFQVIETIDSDKLALRLDAMLAHPRDVMIEVKLSEEQSKEGAAPAELPALIEAIHGCAHLRLVGLMTMPPWNADPEAARPYFKRLAELARMHRLEKLSMGMSHDLETAIEEGATHVRVGQALFGPRPKGLAQA